MPIEFRCPQCAKLLRTPDDTAGKQAKCPECGTLTTIPAATARVPSPPAPVSVPVAPPSTPPAGNPFGAFTPTQPSATINPYQAPPPGAYAAAVAAPGGV